jgi:hypothetical protein
MSDSIVHLDERPACPACSGPMALPHIVPERRAAIYGSSPILRFGATAPH